MKVQELQAAAEAILFASGDPLEITRIAEALELDTEYTEKLLERLGAELDERESGICLLKLEDRYQLCTRTQFAGMIRSVLEVKKNTPLSQAAFEVLAVVAYNQPITKSYIEQVRGVDCSGVIATLCQRGLVEEKGRLELPGRPLLYGTTPNFLKCFCLSSLSELPELPEKNEPGLEEVIKEAERTGEPALPPLEEDEKEEPEEAGETAVPEDGDDIYTAAQEE
ncbi:MAG: SMC-Scp complex subunit ScpB [Clostridiales bacterium]|nr:SMC-Scp complex subunit ScpB [Clostridiales bacterium]